MTDLTPVRKRAAVRHPVFQTSLMSALLDGVYDGDTTIGELTEHGDFGLGTFEALDGEMLILDSICYRLRTGGAVTVATADQRTPFAVVTRFIPTITATLPADVSRDEVSAIVDDLTQSANYLYAMRIAGEFELVRTRTVARQDKPYRPLRQVTKGEPTTEFRDVAGLVAGFRTPLYEAGIGVPGGHVHFIDDERTRGGHVLDFQMSTGTIELCLATDLALRLPLSDEFSTAHLAPRDLTDQLRDTENHA